MTRLNKFAEKELELKKRMRRLNIHEKDVKESFILSSGPGGQNVNKVATCVQLTHILTGIQVKCQEERTQALNRHTARFLLVEKIEHMIHEQHVKEVSRREKLKRQNRKRPKALKERILEAKHKKSEKKSFRHKINPRELERYS